MDSVHVNITGVFRYWKQEIVKNEKASRFLPVVQSVNTYTSHRLTAHIFILLPVWIQRNRHNKKTHLPRENILL